MGSSVSCLRTAPPPPRSAALALIRPVLRVTLQAGICLLTVHFAAHPARGHKWDGALIGTGLLFGLDTVTLPRRRETAGWNSQKRPPWSGSPVAGPAILRDLAGRIGQLWASWWNAIHLAALAVKSRIPSRLTPARRRARAPAEPRSPEFRPADWQPSPDIFAQCMAASLTVLPPPVRPDSGRAAAALEPRTPARTAECVLLMPANVLRHLTPPPARRMSAAYRARRRLEIAAKQVVDRVGAATLLLLATPLMAAIALSIVLDSPGPVIFTQMRTGRWRVPFTILKFRTMAQQRDAMPARQTERNDARCTRVGRFLRRSSLDELPQLWNVLRGDMSLVGPRPHAEELHARERGHGSIAPLYETRYDMKPGLTGWAQIHGLRGAVHSPEQMRMRVEYDIAYIRNWTFWLDLKILARTPRAILGGENAF